MVLVFLGHARWNMHGSYEPLTHAYFALLRPVPPATVRMHALPKRVYNIASDTLECRGFLAHLGAHAQLWPDAL